MFLSLTHCFLILCKVPLPLLPSQSPGTHSFPRRGFSSVSPFCMNSVIPGHEHNTHLKRPILKHKIHALEVLISILIQAILQSSAGSDSRDLIWANVKPLIQLPQNHAMNRQLNPTWSGLPEAVSVQGTHPGLLCIN